jgi:hypothetical protein
MISEFHQQGPLFHLPRAGRNIFTELPQGIWQLVLKAAKTPSPTTRVAGVQKLANSPHHRRLNGMRWSNLGLRIYRLLEGMWHHRIPPRLQILLLARDHQLASLDTLQGEFSTRKKYFKTLVG